MNNVRRLGDRMTIPIKPDGDGFTGRECPQSECEGYFKIEFGTGLKGEGLPCHCPYCGHAGPHDQFFTKAQIEYAKSVAMKAVTEAIRADLKKMEFDHKPRGGFGIGISMKLKPGTPTRIHHYREQQLETEVACANCTLRYAIYGVFAYCPDCGQHNSLQILERNLAVVRKMMDMASSAEPEVATQLVENALEDCVSSFDGFGREICRVHANLATKPEEARQLSFQNLEAAGKRLNSLFAFDLSIAGPREDWDAAIRGFQKRHLLSHKMGVVDEEYLRRSGDTQAVVGRKVTITAEEVRKLVEITEAIALSLKSAIEARA